LSALQQIEVEQGRIKKRHWGERLIDLDILLYADLSMNTPNLTIPHAEITRRDFVLIPLAEISPGLVIPSLGPVETLISNLDTSYLNPLNHA
jgi:7,8-dihydro-6-hydroxymethylpterin-pyrophosphokinase